MEWSYKIQKKEVKVFERWQGHYIEDEKKIELIFKDFTCPVEGGEIIGHTTDGRTAKGRIEGKRKVVFMLEGANFETLYFEG